MSTSLTAYFKITPSWTYLNTDDLGLEITDRNTVSYSKEITNGEGQNQAEFVWRDRRTVTLATTTDDIDTSALVDVFGNAISAQKLRGLVIINRATTAGEDLLVGGATSGAIASLLNGSQTAKEEVRAGGAIAKFAPLDGYTLIPGSEDTLRIAHAGSVGDIQYDIIIFGTR